MANAGTLSFSITAVDKAGPVIEKVRSALASLGKGGTSGLSGGFSGLRDQITKTGTALDGVASPLSAITGVGTIYGLARLANQWGAFNTQLGFSAARLNTQVSSLHAMQGASRLLGGSAEAMTDSFRSFREVMTDAAGGRNNAAVGYLGIVRTRLRDSAGQINKSRDGFYELADGIASVADPELQMRVMRTFGIAENMWPVIRRGSGALRQAEERARYFGVSTERGAAAGREFTEATTELGLALEGMGNSIGETVGPSITSMVGGLAEGVRAVNMFGRENRWTMWAAGGLATYLGGRMVWGLGRAAFGFVGLISSMRAAQAAMVATQATAAATSTAVMGAAGASGILALLTRLAPFLGLAGAAGVVGLGITQLRPVTPDQRDRARGAFRNRGGAGGFYADPSSATPAPLQGGSTEQRAGEVTNRLADDLGLTREQAAGITGNLWRESGLQGINERNPLVPGSRGGFGWAQWTGPRRVAFEQWAQRQGLDPSSDQANYGFLRHEIQNTPHGRSALAAVRQTNTPEAAAAAFLPFETGGDPRAITALPQRQGFASRAAGSAAAQGPYSAGAAQPGGQPGEVNMRVTVVGPPGTTATVQATGANVAQPRVERAMPGYVTP